MLGLAIRMSSFDCQLERYLCSYRIVDITGNAPTISKIAFQSNITSEALWSLWIAQMTALSILLGFRIWIMLESKLRCCFAPFYDGCGHNGQPIKPQFLTFRSKPSGLRCVPCQHFWSTYLNYSFITSKCDINPKEANQSPLFYFGFASSSL